MKKSDILFTAIMGLGMSIIMTLVITYIKPGMDKRDIRKNVISNSLILKYLI